MLPAADGGGPDRHSRRLLRHGAGIYWTAYYLVTDRSALASQQGSTTLRSAVAIVLGILLVLELPQGLFRRLAGPFLRA